MSNDSCIKANQQSHQSLELELWNEGKAGEHIFVRLIPGKSKQPRSLLDVSSDEGYLGDCACMLVPNLVIFHLEREKGSC